MNGTGNGETNKGVITTIIYTLAVVCLVCVTGVFVLVFHAKEVPTELWLLTSNAMTGLTAMLVKTTPTPSTPNEQKPSGTVTVPEQRLETTT